jgi:hypothetical protein
MNARLVLPKQHVRALSGRPATFGPNQLDLVPCSTGKFCVLKRMVAVVDRDFEWGVVDGQYVV